MEKYDIAVIGSGPGGYASAIEASKRGSKVCLIEKDKIGGVCLNSGCVPTKSIIYSARTADIVKSSSKAGINTLLMDVNMQKISEISVAVTENLRKSLNYTIQRYGIDFIKGKGILRDKNTIEVEKTKENLIIHASNIILACGSSGKNARNFAIDGKKVINSSLAIKLNYVPNSVLIIGAGAVGTEFACIFNSLGSKVYLVEAESFLLPSEDQEVTLHLKRSFIKKGINVLTDSFVENVKIKGSEVEIDITGQQQSKTIAADLVLSALGRIPNTEGMGFKESGIEFEGNFIKVNEKMQTSLEGVYAVGDIVNSGMFAHVAYKEADTAVKNIFKEDIVINYKDIPNVVYSRPEMSSLGETEEQIKLKNIDYDKKKIYFKANAKAVITAEDDGFIKILIDKKNKKIVGAHMIGYNSSELIHAYVMAKSNNINTDSIKNIVCAHPTFSEMLSDIFKF